MPDGTDIRLTRQSGEYLISVNAKPLMSSRMHGSEEALATLACDDARGIQEPRVLVGGLGMGFTLRAVLNILPSAAVVTVAELVPAVIKWNRCELSSLADHPLRDPRVRVEVGDVRSTLRANPGHFDVILLDVDNGPSAFAATSNAGLYDNGGVAVAHAALNTQGTLAVWSAWEDRKFAQRLRFCGFAVDIKPVRARLKKGGPKHIIFLGRKGRMTDRKITQ